MNQITKYEQELEQIDKKLLTATGEERFLLEENREIVYDLLCSERAEECYAHFSQTVSSRGYDVCFICGAKG